MDIKATLTLEPRHFGALSGMGLIFMNRGDFQRALVAFTAVQKIYPFSISAAANIFISKKIARENQNSVVVTIICDRGDRYLSKL